MAALLVMPMLNSCRKGENDPGISFRSRESRLMQHWQLVKVEGTEQYVFDGQTLTFIYSYDGSIYTISGSGQSGSMMGTFDIEFLEHGKVNINETLTADGATNVYKGTGTWQWLDSDKSQNYLFVDGATMFGGGILYIDRLANKELVLKESYEENDDGDMAKVEFTYTFEPK